MAWWWHGSLHLPSTSAGIDGSPPFSGHACIGQPQIRYSDPNPPRSPMWIVVRSVLRGCKSSSVPPGPAPTASPVSATVWGARRARFGLSIPNGNVLRGRIEGGRGVGQWGVARAWHALQLLDKPTRAVQVPFCLFSTLSQNQRPPGHEIPAQNGRAHRVPGVFCGTRSCQRT